MKHGRALYSILKNDTPVKDKLLISGGDDIRFYAQRIPQGVEDFPSVTYKTISNNPFNTKSGSGTYRARVQVNVYDITYKKAENLASLIEDALGDKPYGVYDTVTVHTIKTINNFDNTEDFARGQGLFHFIVEFMITYNK